MKFTDLAMHLHTLRQMRSRRNIGSAMRSNEVGKYTILSDQNSITEIYYRHADLPDDAMGAFARLRNPDGSEFAVILINKRMPKHWQEFVAIKETMHCWSPPSSYVSGAHDVGLLLQGHLKVGSYAVTPAIGADNEAIAAAAEVMLPLPSISPYLEGKIDCDELAHRHGLHRDIVAQICQFDMVRARQNGSF